MECLIFGTSGISLVVACNAANLTKGLIIFGLGGDDFLSPWRSYIDMEFEQPEAGVSNMGDALEFIVNNFYCNARAAVMWGSGLGVEWKVRNFLPHHSAYDIINSVSHAVARFPLGGHVLNPVALFAQCKMSP